VVEIAAHLRVDLFEGVCSNGHLVLLPSLPVIKFDTLGNDRVGDSVDELLILVLGHVVALAVEHPLDRSVVRLIRHDDDHTAIGFRHGLSDLPTKGVDPRWLTALACNFDPLGLFHYDMECATGFSHVMKKQVCGFIVLA